MRRVVEIERGLTLAAADSAMLESARYLSAFAERRIEEKGRSYDGVDAVDVDGGRDFLVELAEELADGRNYAVWEMQRNGVDPLVLDVLEALVVAFDRLTVALNEREVDLLEEEPEVKLGGYTAIFTQEFPKLTFDPPCRKKSYADFMKSWLRPHDFELPDDPERDELLKAQAFEDAGERAIEEQDAGPRWVSVPTVRIGARVQVTIPEDDAYACFNGRQGVVIGWNTQRGANPVRVRFDGQRGELSCKHSELRVLP